MLTTQLCFVFLHFFQTISSEQSDECDLSKIEFTEKCCKLPEKHQTFYEFICEQNCSAKNQIDDIFKKSNAEDLSKLKICIEKCFESFINEAGQKVLSHYYYIPARKVDPWAEVLNLAQEKCKLQKTEILSEKMAVFEICVKNILLQNCIEFVENSSCMKANEKHRRCFNVRKNCKEPIMSTILFMRNAHMCCDVPRLTYQFHHKCFKSCQKMEYFNKFSVNCVGECYQNETKIVSADGSIDFEIVKNLMTTHLNESVDWSEAIESSIQFCSKEKYGGLKIEKFEKLNSCMTSQLSKRCRKVREYPGCASIRQFVKECGYESYSQILQT